MAEKAPLQILLSYALFTHGFIFMDTKKHGGLRRGSGRPAKSDKSQWGQITCVLKKETIEALKAGAKSKHFGEFLQFHLDRYPPPSREIYLALLNREPIIMKVRGRRTPVLMSSGSYGSDWIRKRPVRRAPARPLTNKEFEDAIVAAGP
ncbi:MAG TPA: hypothetical protein VFP71_03060 [Candidatus Angelobacter sp.]|nr:hypothetical protein [Candidatus Angelobacter sp.]